MLERITPSEREKKMGTLNKITIDDVEYIRADSVNQTPEPEGHYVVVRCRNAGVHAGYLNSRGACTLRLDCSRRLWRWWSKFTLSELAIHGVHKDKRDEVQFACEVPVIELTHDDVCEVIYCTAKARESIQSIEAVDNE